MQNLKILITEITNKIGEAVYNLLLNETNHEILALSGKPKKFEDKFLDVKTISVLDLKEIKKYCYDTKPDIIIHTAELSKIDECEKDKKLAWDLNVASTEHLASISRVIDSHLICFSTDYVFDDLRGPYTEEDKPNPINYFGKTKHAMENACLFNLNKASVLRVCSPYGYSENNNNDFIYDAISRLDSGKEVSACCERYFNPVYIDDIGLATMKIINRNRFGLFNCGGSDLMNEYEVLTKVASTLTLDIDKIKQKPFDKNLNRLNRPKKGGLVTLKAETDLDMKFSSIESGALSIRFQLNNISQFYK